MELTPADIKTLKKWGYRKKDIEQIEVATSLTRYKYNDKLICDGKARKLLGDEEYLSGISRSAFHYTAARYTPGGETIFFDSSALFNEGVF